MSISSTNLFKNVSSVDISPKFDGYTGVRILTGLQDDNGTDIVYFAGTETGRVLECTNEWGTQAMANNILARITGWQYQPYEASDAIINPAAELNDGVTINDVYSGICVKATTFGRLMSANLSAPEDKEIDHEYAYESKTDREYKRALKETKATLKIQASQIAAKVESSGGSSSSFGWVLTDSDWKLYSDGEEVLRVDDDGLYVVGNGTFTGTIYASAGEFTGTIHATSGEFTGEVHATSGEFKGIIQASSFQTSTGSVLATLADLENIRQASSGTAYSGGTSGFVNAFSAAAGYGKATNQNATSFPDYFKAAAITCGSLGVGNVGTWHGSFTCATATITGSLELAGRTLSVGAAMTDCTVYVSSTVQWIQSGEWLEAATDVDSVNTTDLFWEA